MENFIDFWNNIESWQRVTILLGGMIFFWILEGYYPLSKKSFNRYKHAGVNLVFLATTILLNVLLGIITLQVCAYTQENNIGLLNILNIPIWIKAILGLMLMDFFSQYFPHYLMHKVKFMWKFHMIHHSDTKVDVTTGTRHHPGEWIFRESTTILGVLLVGLPIWMYFLYRSVSALFTHFNHADIHVPEWLDRPLSWIFISPNMHKVHHHFKRPYTDTNYSNIFSIWDRLFGTFAYTDPTTLRYGLDVLDDQTDEDLLYQFKLPFNKNIRTDE